MSRAHPTLGHVYGLRTKKGISLLQLAEIPLSQSSLVLTRICNGFLPPDYTMAEIKSILGKKELFFLETPLFMVQKGSKIYSQFFEFDFPGQLPESVQLPLYQRGFTVLQNGTVKWYKKRRGSDFREYINRITSDFLELSPDNCWSLPDICEFLEEGKNITDYI